MLVALVLVGLIWAVLWVVYVVAFTRFGFRHLRPNPKLTMARRLVVMMSAGVLTILPAIYAIRTIILDGALRIYAILQLPREGSTAEISESFAVEIAFMMQSQALNAITALPSPALLTIALVTARQSKRTETPADSPKN